MTKITSCNKSNGFTLIELLVVIAIVSIIAAVAIPAFASQQSAASLATAKSDGRSLSDAVSAQALNYSSYGAAAADTNTSIGYNSTTGIITFTAGTGSTKGNNVVGASAVTASKGSTVSSSGASARLWCFTVTNNGQNAVYTQSGFQSGSVSCNADGTTNTSTGTVFSSAIINGDFLSTSLTGWRFDNTASAVSTVQAHSGTQSLHIVDQPANDPTTSLGVYTGTGLAAKNYTISFWVYTPLNAQIYVQINGAQVYLNPGNVSYVSTARSTWQQISIVDPAPLSGSFTVTVGDANGFAFYVDDIVMQ